MSNVGTIDIALQLLGKDKIKGDLTELLGVVRELEKSHTIKVDVSQIIKAATAQEKVTQASEKTAQAQLKTQTAQEKLNQLKTAAAVVSEKVTQAVLKTQQAEEKLAQAADRTTQAKARQADAAERAAVADYRRQERVGGVAGAAAQATLDKQEADALARRVVGIQNVASVLNGAGNVATKVGGLFDSAVQGITRFGDGMIHAGQIAATFSYRLLLITAPLDALIATAIKFGSEFEMLMYKAASQLDAPIAKMREFAGVVGDQIMAISQKLPVAATDLATALYYLVSSGLGEASTKMLEPIARLATAGKASAEEIAKALVVAFAVYGDELKKYGDTTAQATHVTEVFWEAVKVGRAEVSDVAVSFARFAQFVKEAGGSFEEATSAWAILTRAFTAPQAATALENLAKNITAPSDAAKEAWKSLDIELRDVDTGQLRGFTAIMGELFEKLREYKGADVADILATLFPNIRGEQVALFYKNIQNWKDYLAELAKARGSVSSLGDGVDLMMEKQDTLWILLTNNFQAFQNTISKEFAPVVKGALVGLITALQELAGNPRIVRLFTDIAGALAVAAPAALVLGTALMGVGAIIETFGTLLQPHMLISIAALWQVLGPAIKDAAEGVALFGGGLKGTVGFVTELAVQLGLIKSSDAARIFQELGISVSSMGSAQVTKFINDFRAMLDVLTQAKDSMMTFARGFALFIDNVAKGEGYLGGVYKALKGIADTILPWLTGGKGLTEEGVAGALDKIIAGAIGLKLLGAILHLTAGIVNVFGPVMLAGAVKDVMIGGEVVAGGTAGGGLLAGITPIAAAIGAAVGVAVADALAMYAVAKYGEEKATKEVGYKATFSESLFSGLDQMTKDIFAWLNRIPAALDGLAKQIEAGLAKAGEEFSFTVFKIVTGQINIGEAVAGVESGMIGFVNAIFATIIAVVRSIDLTDISWKIRDGVDTLVNQILSALGLPQFGSRATRWLPGDAPPINYQTPQREAGIGIPGEAPPGQGAQGYGNYPVPVQGAPADRNYPMSPEARQTLSLNQWLAAVDGARIRAEHLGQAFEWTKEQLDAFAKKLESAANGIVDAVKGLVESAMAPTSVSAEDVAATQAGTYVDKWDEFRRRLEAVATGTDPAQYGAEFVQKLNEIMAQFPGLAIKTLADKFKDFSLFAGMSGDQIREFVNFGPITDAVQQGIDAIIGKFRAVGEGVKEVFKTLSNEKLFDLAQALGIDTAGMAMQDLRTTLEAQLQQMFGGTGTGQVVKVPISPVLDTKAKSNIAAINNTIQTSIKDKTSIIDVDITKALAGIAELEAKFVEFMKNYATVIIKVFLTVSQNSGTGSDQQSGGYVRTDADYRLAEGGAYEYVLPHPVVAGIERLLNGQITTPYQILRMMNEANNPRTILPIAAGASAGGANYVFDFKGAQFLGSGPETAYLISETVKKAMRDQLNSSMRTSLNLSAFQG